jgi:hypothetical protein
MSSSRAATTVGRGGRAPALRRRPTVHSMRDPSQPAVARVRVFASAARRGACDDPSRPQTGLEANNQNASKHTTGPSQTLFIGEYSRHCSNSRRWTEVPRCWRLEESSKNGMVTHSASNNTESGHAMPAAAARTTQTLAARATSRRTKRWPSGLAACCERVKAACALVAVGSSCTARLGGVRAFGRQRRRCGRVRTAWVLGLVSSPAS